MVIKQPTVVLATGRTMSGGMKSQERVFPVLVEILFQAHVLLLETYWIYLSAPDLLFSRGIQNMARCSSFRIVPDTDEHHQADRTMWVHPLLYLCTSTSFPACILNKRMHWRMDSHLLFPCYCVDIKYHAAKRSHPPVRLGSREESGNVISSA
jgi:hypothetical protein